MGQETPYDFELIEYGNIQNAVDYFLEFQIATDKSVLDIGTNLGTFVYELHLRGYKSLHGIDIREDAIRHGQRKYPVISNNLLCYDGHTIPFDSGRFDVITMFDVIEHIPDIATFMLEANRVMARGGRLIFQTPNIYINSVWSTIALRSFIWRKYHCSLQSLSSLRKLLSQSGFRGITIDKRSVDTEFNRTLASKHLGSMGPALLKFSKNLPLDLYPNFYGSALK